MAGVVPELLVVVVVVATVPFDSQEEFSSIVDR